MIHFTHYFHSKNTIPVLLFLGAIGISSPVQAEVLSVKDKASATLNLGNGIYSLGKNRGNAVIINGCAYRVMTRIKLSGKKQTHEIVPGDISRLMGKEGTQVCSEHMTKYNIPMEEIGENLYKLKGHPLVVVKELDGALTVFPGKFNIDTKQWQVEDYTKGLRLLSPKKHKEKETKSEMIQT